MKVTIVLPFINLTGGIRVMLDYANCIHDRGHEAVVVYPCWPYRFQYSRRQQWGEFRKSIRQNGRVAWFSLRCPLLRVPVISPRFVPPADLVIATAWPTVLDVARLGASHGKKVHVVMHHESGTGPEHLIRGIYRFPFERVTFSEFIRNSIRENFGSDIRHVVPNGVDLNVFFPDASQTPNSVLFLYHPDPRKGASDGIQVLTRLRRRVPGLRVKVCGTVRPASLPAWLPFEFHIGDALLRRRYSESTAVLYPSRYEGFGLPPLEAMACGCPPVTTAVGAVPEYARHGRDALVTAVGDLDAMVAGLERLLSDHRLRRRLSRGGLATAERYALRRVGPLFVDALESILRQ
jgi:glycosyltransferase involved in cell wall biosynthesis